tara:strand:- start:14125 stop:15660 length:1536 start_codon:yes stop_codon:yes gene_type:complete
MNIWLKPSLMACALSAGLLSSTAVLAQDLNIAIHATISHFDPQDSNNSIDYIAQGGIFQRLIGFDEHLNIVPELAESWEANEAATEFTFKLRKGVRFHDGTDFDANAVKVNIERMADQSLNLKRNSLMKNVDRVEVIDSETVKIILKEPFGAMIATIAHPSVVMHSPAALEKWGKEVSKNPVGTGPFKYSEWVPGERITMVKNDDYWEEGWPKVDKVTLFPVSESGTRVAMLRSDEVQYVFTLPPELAEAVKEADGYIVNEKDGIRVWTASMNLLKDKFKDVRVRQAFNYAFNNKAFVKVMYSGHGSEPTSSIAPNTAHYSAQEPYNFDLEKARALMKEAGYENGMDVEIWGQNSTAGVRLLQFLKQQLSQINVNAKIVPMESATRSQKVFRIESPEEAEYDMVIGGWSPSTGDADWHIRPVYGKEGWIPQIYNMAFYENPTVEENIQAALNTADNEKRAEAYKIAQEHIWKDAPVVWLGTDNVLSAQSEKVDGLFITPDGHLSYNYAEFK